MNYATAKRFYWLIPLSEVDKSEVELSCFVPAQS